MATINNNISYDAHAKRWAVIRAFTDGESELKRMDLARVGKPIREGDTSSPSFIRRINPSDLTVYNKQNNINNINGAVLYNAVVKTRSGLLGMLYRKEPIEAELPEAIEYIYKNVDGSGLSMMQQSRSLSSDIVSIGRGGLLTDMPINEGRQITQADVDAGYRASIQFYRAESIVDWHETVINNVKALDLLILLENIETIKPGTVNERELSKQYKVYRLTAEGVTIEVYTESKERGEDLVSVGAVAVMAANNTPLRKIPFEFVGSKDNQPDIDSLPLEPIAAANRGHYQESANLAETSFNLSACQPVIADDNYARYARDPKNEGSVELGSKSVVVLGSGGSFSLVAPPPNPLAKAVQDGYKDQMIELGAQLITSGGMAETAEAAKLKHSSDVSDLEIMSSNISEAYTKSIEHVCALMGVDYESEYKFKLNDEFFDMALSADDAVKWVSVWQGGAMSKTELDTIMVKGKAIDSDVDLDAMNALIDEEQVSNVNFDDPQGGAEE